jgi:hypothetical protein
MESNMSVDDDGHGVNSFEPVVEDAELFCRIIAGNEPMTFQWFADDKSGPVRPWYFTGTIEQHVRKLADLNKQGAGIFAMVNPGDGLGRSEENVTGVRAAFVDLDGAPLAPVLDWHIKPHLITATSIGKDGKPRYQAFWLVTGFPWNGDLRDNKSRFSRVQVALKDLFHGDPKITKDLCRVMRVPGFWHRKREPQLCTIYDYSEHPPYEFTEFEAEVLDGQDQGAHSEEKLTNVETEVDHELGTIAEGSRNDELFKHAAKQRKLGYGFNEILPMLQAVNRERCTPPVSDRELQSIVRSACKILPDNREDSKGAKPPSLINFSKLMEMDLPEPQWIINDLLPEGVTLFAGAPKIGKSWLCQHLSLAVAAGGMALGHFQCRQGSVLHLALEDSPRRFKNRMLKMWGNNTLPACGQFTNTWPHFSEDPKQIGGLEHIHRWTEQHADDAKLVIIDTLQKLRFRKRTNNDPYGNDYRDLEGLQRLAGQYSIAIVVVHHTNQGEHEDFVNRVSGTTGLIGAADTIMVLEKTSRGEADGTLSITGRDIEESKGALTFNKHTGLWKWLGGAADLAMTRERRAIRDALRTTGAPMKPADIAGITGSNRKSVGRLLGKMLESGEVEKAAGQAGKYVLPPEDNRYGQPWNQNMGESDDSTMHCM